MNNIDYTEPALYRPCKDLCGFDCGNGVQVFFLFNSLSESFFQGEQCNVIEF